MNIRRGVLIFCMLLVPTSALADCFFNGRRYPEGARVGSYVCENNHWVLRQ
jgi:hypothetical protein